MPRRFSGDTLVVATHNAKKVVELRALLGHRVKNIVTAPEVGVEAPVETGTTFFENALIKALAVAKAANLPALADDSGIAIAALNGAPGVYSADWAENPDGSRDFHAAINKVKTEIEKKWGTGGNFPPAAHFVCCLALAWPDGHFEIVEGLCFGTISFPPKGDDGFGYDPIFTALEKPGRTFGEMPMEEKNAISHRADALRQMLDKCF